MLITPATTPAAGARDGAEGTDPPIPEVAAPDGAAAPADEARTEAAYHFARAKLLADGGAFDRALTAFGRALDLDRSDPYLLLEVSKFHAYLAQISQGDSKRLANLRAAAEYAAEARELEPENLDVLRSYGQLQMRLVEQHQLESLKLAQEAFEELRRRTEGDLQVLLSLGQLYLWQRQHAAAAEVLEEAARYRPDHPTIEGMLVDALLGAGESRRAEELLERIVARDPSSLDDRLRLAELLGERGDHRRAVEILKSAPESLFAAASLRRALARELHLSGSNEEALAATDTLLEDFSADPGLRRLRVAILSALTRYQEAMSELEPLVEGAGDGDAPPRDELLMSRLLERVGRPDDAAELLRELAARTSGPHAGQVKMALLALLERQGLGAEAVDILRRDFAASTGAEAGRSGRLLSQLLVRLDRFAEAHEVIDRTLEKVAGEVEEVERTRFQKLTLLALREDWPRVIELASSLLAAETEELRPVAYLFYGEALAGTGRVDEALALLAEGEKQHDAPALVAQRIEILFAADRGDEATRLLDELTADNEARDLLFAARVHQSAGRYGQAIAVLERLLAQDPSSLEGYFFLGAAYERSGQRQRAVETFERLLELDSDHAPTLNYLGYMWAEQGIHLDRALELVQRAVALEPDNGAYVDSLGWVNFQLGRYDEALRHLEWAARLIRDDPTILEHLGDLYVALQDLERARHSYRQALDLGGDSVDEVRRKLRDLEGKGL
jgi:tetratricopeptide (TPR) repeat protein